MFRHLMVPQSTTVMPPRVPPPSRRHGAPSGPWPFINIEDEVTRGDAGTNIPEPRPCRHSKRSFQGECWCKYPQSLFPNWTPQQQKKSRITKIVEKQGESSLYYLDIMQDGIFVNAGMREVSETNQDLHWAAIQRGRPPGVRTRAIFVENLTGSVLQMLGSRYNIEPFFFSSSIGWIPSRYQSNIVPNRGDHITITLVFVRPIQNPTAAPSNPVSAYIANTEDMSEDLLVDTHSPLLLRSCSSFFGLKQLLALHIVRSPDSSTIIFYHPPAEHQATHAASMHARMESIGHSVYWSRIFQEERDPTLLVLSLLWYAIYAWDEALQRLYAHICFLESRVLARNDMFLTQELHVIRSYLLYYESLLRDFRRTVLFVQNTPFPSLQNPEMYTKEERLRSEEVMKRESRNLLNELKRLESSRKQYDWRLKNVMDLGFSIVNIIDSRRIERLTISSLQDASAMKQITYLTTLFLPFSFVATVFGMNVTVLNPSGSLATLTQYVAIVVPLTALTIWLVVALEINLKQIRVHRVGHRKRARVVSSTKGRSKSSLYVVEKVHGIERDATVQGHDGEDKLDSDEVESEDEIVEEVEVRYVFNYFNDRNRAAKDGETETLLELDIWFRFCWPWILFIIALERRGWHNWNTKRIVKSKSS